MHPGLACSAFSPRIDQMSTVTKTPIIGILSTLRHRNIHRMAALYLAAAWLITQVTEVLMGLARLPSGTGVMVLSLLAVGFPAALVISWFYSDKWWTLGSPIMSFAVLPLESHGVDSGQLHFADGITELLTSELGRIDGLRVVSRASTKRYAETDKPLRVVAKELNVDALVSGSVQWDDEQVKIGLRIHDGETGWQLWSHKFRSHYGGILLLKREIAQAVADEIQASVTAETKQSLASKPRADAEAVKLWLSGFHHLKHNTDDSIAKAFAAFNEAIERDSEFAEAYAGLAQAYLFLTGYNSLEKSDWVLPAARVAADAAIRLDPNLAEAHYALGDIHRCEWSWEAADREFSKGRTLDPNDSFGLFNYSNFLGSMGRHEEAIEAALRGIEVDPFLAGGFGELGFAYWNAGRDDEARHMYKKALELEPGFQKLQSLLALSHIRSGNLDAALRHLKMADSHLDSASPIVLARTGLAYGLIGRENDTRRVLSILQARMKSGYVQPAPVAYVYIGLGEYDEALIWLETAFKERDLSLTWINEDWAFDDIRSNPRFQEILSRMDFPNNN